MITPIEKIIDTAIESLNDADLLDIIDKVERTIIGRRGYRDGRSAGSWVFDGDTEEYTMTETVKGIMNGDPEILDMLPNPSVGGEFADNDTMEDIIASELNVKPEIAELYDDDSSLYNAYCERFSEGVQDEIITTARGYGVIA